MISLSGKTAIITGGASGIGRSIGREMAAAGCAVALLDVDEVGLESAKAEIGARGGKASVARADVSEPASIGVAVTTLAAELGRLDVLVNSAGILRLGSIETLSLQDWADTQRVNVDGLFHTTRAAIPHLRKADAGRIINISSWMGKSGKAYYGAYCASKFAIIALTETLALELAQDRITVNAICPGIIMHTGMRDRAEEEQRSMGLPSAQERIATIPLGRLGQPEDVAAIAVFLASDQASYMTGHTVNVTGGMWLK
jgi:NAD(P)-dependent dehydrogenase (short-subunit alcohol dehydrogenase family)